MATVYGVADIAALKAIDPNNYLTPQGTRALLDGQILLVENIGNYPPSFYCWRKNGGSPGWPTGIPAEIQPIIIAPNTGASEGAWISTSIKTIVSTAKPSDTPVNLFKEVATGLQWLAVLANSAAILYISDGTNWKTIGLETIVSATDPPTIIPDEIGQTYVGNNTNVYISIETSGSNDWVLI